MEFLGAKKDERKAAAISNPLYRALAIGDLPAAWLLTRQLLEQNKMEKPSVSAAFNCGLCLYQLEEYEKALEQLKLAEQSLNGPPDLNSQEKKLFLRAMETENRTALLPLDPENDRELERYALIRVRWLTTLTLIRLDRLQEADPILRFLAQYHIKI